MERTPHPRTPASRTPNPDRFPITLSFPLTQYTSSQLRIWLRQNDVQFPPNANHKELINLVHENSSVGGNQQIFPLSKESLLDVSLRQYLDSLPEESVKSFLNFLPINDIIVFCSTSEKFSNFCKDPNFWEIRSEDIKPSEIFDTA